MNTIVAFLFVLGVLVFVHELGHFLAARRLGVRVLTFSLGFGPKLLKIKRGDTEYCLSAIPLGGYVKMAGENPDDTLSGRPDEFLSRTKWERFQILIMGPVMNIVLAIVVRDHESARDVRDTQIERYGDRIALALTSAGAVIVLGLAMLEVDPFWIGTTLFVLAATGTAGGAVARIRAYRGSFDG